MPVRRSVIAVAVPSEHGGWGLTLEPVILGLVAAPSAAGWLIGVGALIAFLTRTPARIVLVDRRRRRSLERTGLAMRILVAELVALVAVGLLATAWSGVRIWWPVAAAAPLVVVGLRYDARSRSRRLLPEMAGAAGIGSAAAVIGMAGGLGWPEAGGLWVVILARVAASVPFVRLQVRRIKAQPVSLWQSDAAQGCGVGIVALGVVSGAVPVAAGLGIGALAAVQIVMARHRPPSVGVLGAQQVVAGLAVVLVAGLGAAAP